MAGLLDLVQLANNYTGIMVAFLWIAAGIGWKLLQNDIEDNGSDIESLADDHQEVREDLLQVDQKQDHVVQRQEIMLERLGMNEQEIQELREDTARLDAHHEQGDFYRGETSGGD
jgi:hypothetical protein